MLKNILIAIALVAATFVAPAVVYAEDQICVSQYGGGVVCGPKTPEFHTPVKAGFGDINFSLVGGSLIVVSGLLYWTSYKRSKIAL